MTAEEMWQQLVNKDSRLADGKTELKITADSLKKLIFQAYRQGESSSRGEDMFNDLFRNFGG